MTKSPIRHFKEGRFYGFPTCCIFWFCIFSWLPDWVFNPPISIWRRLGVPKTPRQFVPCPYHYKRGLDLHL